MELSQKEKRKKLWLACCLSVIGFLLAWMSEFQWALTYGSADPDNLSWDIVIAAELILFGGIVARLLWVALIKNFGNLPVIRSAIPFLISLAFLGYATLWLLIGLMMIPNSI